MDSFIELLEAKLAAIKDLTISDFDEIDLYWNANWNGMPSLIRDIYNNFDTDSDPTEPEQSAHELERLICALKIQAKLISKKKTVDQSELLPTFELNSGDKQRIVVLCAQMRRIVFASEVFDQPHRKRLLDRIASIEKQLEQPKGMLDVIRGGVSDVGETLGKFGVDIKPLTDRMAEVMQITRAGSKEYEQLPAPEEVKQLPKPSEEEEAKDK